MDLKIPPEIIENFCFSNFKEARRTGSKEIHFNSPIVQDRKMRLYVNPEKSRFFDQKRQVGGSFLSFVAEYLNVSVREASIILIRDYSIGRLNKEVNYKDIVSSAEDIILPDGTKFFFESDENSRTYKRAKKYLEDRSIPLDDLAFVYDPKGDIKESHHNRIIVPFYEEGKLVYFISRTFEKDNILRYKNPKGVDAGNFVFQIDKLTDDVFIFEGVFDALSLRSPQVGTAMLSNKLKPTQITKILDKAPKRIVFVTENDKNKIAIEVGKRNLEWNLKAMMKYKPPSLNIKFYTFNPPLPYKDFNEYSHGEQVFSIDIDKDCIEWNPRGFNINSIQWGSNNAKFFN